MEHMHRVAETLRAERVMVPIDGAVRRVSRTLRGTIVDWNPVDRMYTLDVEGLGAVRLGSTTRPTTRSAACCAGSTRPPLMPTLPLSSRWFAPRRAAKA